MNDRTDAIVLKQSDYRERDVLLSVLSREYGKISFVAPGARKISSKNASSILPYSEVQILFDYREGKSMFRLRTASTISLFRHLRTDLVRSAAAGVLCEVMDALTLPGEDRENAAREYELLHLALQALDQGRDPDSVLSLYAADMLKLFGSAPDVDECTVCGSHTVRALSAEHGGFLCERHAESYGVPFADRESLLRFRILVKAGIERIDLVEEQAKAEPGDTEILMDFIRRYTGAGIRAFAFYRGILQLNRDI